MFSHVMLGAEDIDASKTFYDACFKALGGREGSVDPKGRVIYMHNGGIFLLTSLRAAATDRPSASPRPARNRRMHGTQPGLPQAALRSKIRRASAKARA